MLPKDLIGSERADSRRHSEVSVTAIVCTFNRAASLAATLESLAASRVCESVGWEVLVVDNNSTDGTRQVAEDFCQRFPGRFRYLFEPKTGKSYALNSGIANARGKILVFSDDDVLVEPSWLQNLTAELLRSDTWAGAAGRVLPLQAFAPPPWLDWDGCALGRRGGAFSFDVLSIVFAHFDLGEKAGKIPVNRSPCGANMAFRKHLFDKYGGFRADLGANPNSKIRSEDTEFGKRLQRGGEHLWYEPSAVVYHPVLESRLKKEYVLSYWFDCGRASIRERDDRPAVCGIPWNYLSIGHRVLEILITTSRWAFAKRPQKSFFYKCMVWMQTGMVVELYSRSIRGHSGPEATP